MRSESVPALEASWAAAREAERLRSIALRLAAEPGIEGDAYEVNSASESLERLEDALATASSVPELVPPAQAVQDAAYGLTEVIDNLAVYRNALIEANAAAADLQQRVDGLSVDDSASQIALVVLNRAMLASNKMRCSDSGASSRVCMLRALTRPSFLWQTVRVCSRFADGN